MVSWQNYSKNFIGGLIAGVGFIFVVGGYFFVQAVAPGSTNNPSFAPGVDNVNLNWDCTGGAIERINADGSVVCTPANDCQMIRALYCGGPDESHPSCPAGWTDTGYLDPIQGTDNADWCHFSATLCCR